ncbi:ATP-binding protein [Roseateles sp. BYS180W]|uniref:histidine kinase n=1 Tax=Roseateles rivi TaxID=3299028 RepID=A0ABW7FRG5_9BURK
MFRTKLLLALSVLGLLAVLQGAVALWAQHTAAQQVQRGRLTSDILTGFVELSANKQRLRSWTAQLLLTGEADLAVRTTLLADMRRELQQLHERSLALDALESELGESGRREQRQRSLNVLDQHVDDLAHALHRMTPTLPGADSAEVWRRMRSVFDESRGQDLRRLLLAEIEQERSATSASRMAADRALATMRAVVVGLSVTAALMTVALASYFMLSLRRPLDELMHGVQALQGGDLNVRLRESRGDEFGQVARGFNAMAAELQQHRLQEQADRAMLEQMVQSRTAELRQAHDTLQAMDGRRRRFFAEISHELRTPATAIRGEAEITLRGPDRSAAEYRQALQHIVATVEQFSQVLEDMSLLARAEVQQLALQCEWLDWPQWLQAQCQQAEVLARAQGLRMQWQIDATTPSGWGLRADAKRLRQVLGIVLDNARRYSNPGTEIELRAQVQEQRLVLTLRDQGIGINAQELPEVFERHFRGEAARRHRPDGLGLGLPIARYIVQAHEGDIKLTSAAQQGTVVQIRLPLSRLTSMGDASS